MWKVTRIFSLAFFSPLTFPCQSVWLYPQRGTFPWTRWETCPLGVCNMAASQRIGQRARCDSAKVLADWVPSPRNIFYLKCPNIFFKLKPKWQWPKLCCLGGNTTFGCRAFCLYGSLLVLYFFLFLAFETESHVAQPQTPGRSCLFWPNARIMGFVGLYTIWMRFRAPISLLVFLGLSPHRLPLPPACLRMSNTVWWEPKASLVKILGWYFQRIPRSVE